MLRLDTRWPLSYVSLCSGIPEQLLEWDRYFHSLPPCYPPWGRPESWRTQLSPESEARQRRAAWRRGSPDIVDQVREAAAARMTARGTHSTNSHPPPPPTWPPQGSCPHTLALPPHPALPPCPSIGGPVTDSTSTFSLFGMARTTQSTRARDPCRRCVLGPSRVRLAHSHGGCNPVCATYMSPFTWVRIASTPYGGVPQLSRVRVPRGDTNAMRPEVRVRGCFKNTHRQ